MPEDRIYVNEDDKTRLKEFYHAMLHDWWNRNKNKRGYPWFSHQDKKTYTNMTA